VRSRKPNEAKRRNSPRVRPNNLCVLCGKIHMPIVKKREIEKLEQMSGEELKRFLDRLPERQQTISKMLDYIEDQLWDSECDDHLKHAMRFMMDNRLDFPKLTSWLNQNGGYCDCKVLEQIAPLWRVKFGDD
jgi:hypothetical protein